MIHRNLYILLFGLIPLLTTAQDSSSYYTNWYQKKAHNLFERSISFVTSVNSGHMPAYVDYLAGQFMEGGFPKEDIHILPFTASNGEKLAALLVRYSGSDKSTTKPILLMAHLDVVVADRKDWELDPFKLTERNGYFFGRGTIDNKMGVVMLTTTFLRLKAEGFIPTRDLIIVFTGDEEIGGMTTTKGIVEEHFDLIDAEYALNSDMGIGVLNESFEPVSFNLDFAEKTFATFEMTVRNPGGHSSAPRSDNAIYDLANALRAIQKHQFPVQYNDITLRYFELAGSSRSDELGEAMVKFSQNPSDETAHPLRKDPIQHGKLCTTCVATMLRAGHADNALPQSATATINCRIFPGISVETVQEELEAVVGNEEIEFRMLDNPQASDASPINNEVIEAVRTVIHKKYPGLPIIPTMSASSSDALYFRAAGIPTYGVRGAFIRDEDMFMHGLNERVNVSSFFNGLEYWHSLLTHLVGPPK